MASGYFDYTATAPVLAEVLSCYPRWLEESFANPASPHALGVKARSLLNDSLRQLAQVVGCNANDVIITSGGTEAINTVLSGIRNTTPKRIIISSGEHEATAECAKNLEKMGTTVDVLPLVASGEPDYADLETKLQTHKYDLISLLHVSNETGAALNVNKVQSLRQQYQPRALIHLDGVQAFGKVSFNFAQTGIDAYSISGHKIGAPKSVGALVLKHNHRLRPLLFGGRQQENRRSGTENPALVAAFALAAQISHREQKKAYDIVCRNKEFFIKSLLEANIDFTLVSGVNCVPHICAVTFWAVLGETMRNALSNKGFYVSVGSACSSGHASKSGINHALKALGIDDNANRHTVRISFAKEHTQEDIALLVDCIKTICEQYGGLNE